MSYRLIDSNAIAIKYPEVNEMPCVFADLPYGINGQFIYAQPERKRGKWIEDALANNIYRCSECGIDAPVEPTGGTEYKSNYGPNCGCEMER